MFSQSKTEEAVSKEQPLFYLTVEGCRQSTPILIYDHKEAYKLGKIISLKEYKNAYLLEGFYDFVWSSFNVGSCKEAENFIINHGGVLVPIEMQLKELRSILVPNR